jgi:hypothetical protein
MTDVWLKIRGFWNSFSSITLIKTRKIPWGTHIVGQQYGVPHGRLRVFINVLDENEGSYVKLWLDKLSGRLWGEKEPGGQGVAMVTRDFMGPLGGFWSKPSRKRVTGWNDNMHVTFCTNYAVWEWVLVNKTVTRPCGTRENKQTNNENEDQNYRIFKVLLPSNLLYILHSTFSKSIIELYISYMGARYFPGGGRGGSAISGGRGVKFVDPIFNGLFFSKKKVSKKNRKKKKKIVMQCQV